MNKGSKTATTNNPPPRRNYFGKIRRVRSDEKVFWHLLGSAALKNRSSEEEKEYSPGKVTSFEAKAYGEHELHSAHEPFFL